MRRHRTPEILTAQRRQYSMRCQSVGIECPTQDVALQTQQQITSNWHVANHSSPQDDKALAINSHHNKNTTQEITSQSHIYTVAHSRDQSQPKWGENLAEFWFNGFEPQSTSNDFSSMRTVSLIYAAAWWTRHEKYGNIS